MLCKALVNNIGKPPAGDISGNNREIIERRYRYSSRLSFRLMYNMPAHKNVISFLRNSVEATSAYYFNRRRASRQIFQLALACVDHYAASSACHRGALVGPSIKLCICA